MKYIITFKYKKNCLGKTVGYIETDNLNSWSLIPKDRSVIKLIMIISIIKQHTEIKEVSAITKLLNCHV